MKWHSSLSENPDASKALDECIGKMRESESAPPDLAFLFPSAHHARSFDALPPQLIKAAGVKQLIGCSGGGIIGGGREVEHKPALSLVAAWLPDVNVFPFHLQQQDLPSPDAPPGAWRDKVGAKEPTADFLILSDPFSLDAEALINGLDYAYPKSVKIGGLASGAGGPGGNVLYLNGRILREGTVGLALTGNVKIDPIVAQGCRPIGPTFKVTHCERNLLLELDGVNTLKALEALMEKLSPKDQQLARTSLFLGILNDPLKSNATKRDYLIRNLIGLDPQRGILAIGALLRPGQTVQFHLRDRETAAHDLTEHLDLYLKDMGSVRPQGALLFSCLGRGEHLYQKPNHDCSLFNSKMGPTAIGGFFCNGEIGPVDGTTYLHGFTSSFGIFRPAEPAINT